MNLSLLASDTSSHASRTSKRKRCSGAALAGVWKDRFIARIGPDEGEAARLEQHVREFDITGKPMRNWVAVEPEGVEDDDQLADWIEQAVKFVKTLPKK